VNKEEILQRNKKFQKVNWIVFAIIVLMGLILISEASEGVKNLSNSQAEDAEQSRMEFRWNTANSTLGIVLLFLSVVLALVWKRTFPFNVPLAIILLGFGYQLYFMTYTVGWVGILGDIGLMISILVAITMIISYTVYFLR
jgi:putative Mn2+ efflux pump MntP